MKLLFISLFLTIASSAIAQTIIEGHVVDSEKNDMIKATVKCVANDSIYLCGTTTNSKGEFKLEVAKNDGVKKLIINYVGYKECVLTINKTKEKTVRLGDITMNKDAAQLREVTVLSSNRVRTEEKTIIYPTKDELRHAYDGYSMLDVMWIPGLTASSVNGSVSFRNESVKLCIDGREATKDEIQDLNPKDIKRIDFYEQGSPEYPESGSVIDYILKERDYAGSVALNATHYNEPYDKGKATVQYFEGKSEFTLSAAGAYDNYTLRKENSTTTIYHFPENDITRTSNSLPSKTEYNNQNIYANYLYKDKMKNFYASLRLNRSESEDGSNSSMEYSNDPILYTRHEYSASQKISPAVQLRYNQSLPQKQRLRVEAYASYGNNHYSRWYENRNDKIVATKYNNGTLEDSYYMSGSINYTKTFKNNSSLNVLASQNFTHTNDLNTREEDTYEVTLDKSNTKLHLTYNYKIQRKFNIQASLATHLTTINTGGTSKTNIFFIPKLKMTYMHKTHSVTLSGTATSQEASIANRTGDEYRINEYEMFTGNPELKDFMNYSVAIHHSWDITPRLEMINYAKYRFSTDRNYQLTNYDSDRNMFINKVINNGGYWNQHYENGLDYTIIPKRLRVRGIFIYEHEKAEAWRKINHDYMSIGIRANFMYKGWRASTGYLTGRKSLNPDKGSFTKSKGNLSFQLNYSINNWHFEAYYMNPFKARTRTTFNNGEYEQYSSSRTPHISDNYAYIHVSYRFTFGKKKHKFDNSEIQDVNQTTISQ